MSILYPDWTFDGVYPSTEMLNLAQRPLGPLSSRQGEGEHALWLSRYAAFGVASGIDLDKAANARAAIDKQLTVLTPEQDEAILRDAGFSNVSLFYVGFTFRGWVGYA